jgi:hypothetical protein
VSEDTRVDAEFVDDGTTAMLTINVKNMGRLKLLLWELTELLDEMRVMASPHAERLDATLTRFAGEDDDDRPTPVIDIECRVCGRSVNVGERGALSCPNCDVLP